MTAGRRIPTVLVAISAAAVLLVPAAPAAAQGVLLDVTVTSQPDALNIFVKTSTEPKYHAELIASPRRPSNGPRLISFDFKDADVVNLLRILAAESTKNIVIGDDVKGKMSISLRNVPWDLAFQTILDTRGLQKIEKDGVIRIVSNDQLLKEREAQARVEESKLKAETEIRAKAAEAKLKEQEAIARERAVELELAQLKARGPLKEETIRLAYADPEDIEKTLLGIASDRKSTR